MTDKDMAYLQEQIDRLSRKINNYLDRTDPKDGSRNLSRINEVLKERVVLEAQLQELRNRKGN